jgi:hypothetical protein
MGRTGLDHVVPVATSDPTVDRLEIAYLTTDTSRYEVITATATGAAVVGSRATPTMAMKVMLIGARR